MKTMKTEKRDQIKNVNECLFENLTENKNEQEQKANIASGTILIPLLKKFIHILKTEVPSYKFGLFKEKTFALIDDKSYFLKRMKIRKK